MRVVWEDALEPFVHNIQVFGDRGSEMLSVRSWTQDSRHPFGACQKFKLPDKDFIGKWLGQIAPLQTPFVLRKGKK